LVEFVIFFTNFTLNCISACNAVNVECTGFPENPCKFRLLVVTSVCENTADRPRAA
jgi:hypothetical protein